MAETSKGGFLDFVEAITDPISPMRDEFIKLLYADGTTAEELLSFFHRMEYDDVSLEDCNKLLIIKKAGNLPCDFNEKY